MFLFAHTGITLGVTELARAAFLESSQRAELMTASKDLSLSPLVTVKPSISMSQQLAKRLASMGAPRTWIWSFYWAPCSQISSQASRPDLLGELLRQRLDDRAYPGICRGGAARRCSPVLDKAHYSRIPALLRRGGALHPR